MAQKNALSRRQFRESEFDASGYEFNQRSGEFVATIDCKRWGKRKKLVTYMTFEDGRRIVAPPGPGADMRDWRIWKLAQKSESSISKAAEETFAFGERFC